MKKLCVRGAVALAIAGALSATGTAVTAAPQQIGPDLSGRWNRESASGDAGADSSRWGPQVDIDQFGISVRVRSGSSRTELYLLDGTETAEVLSVDGCKNLVRITKSVVDRNRMTITTWLVTKSGCVHGEIEDEPNVYRTGPVAVRDVRGTRKLESISVVSRDGNALTVETTRSAPGVGTTSSTTTYRR